MSAPDISGLAQPAQSQQPAPSTGHARLLSMIQGLAVGVGAFGRAAATGGREGGVQDVQAFQQKQQEMQLASQAGQRLQQESDLRMKTMNANLLMNEAAYHHALQMYPAEEKEQQLKLENAASQAVTSAGTAGYDLSDPTDAAVWHQMLDNAVKVQFTAGQPASEVMSSITDAASKNGKSITDFVPVTTYNDDKHGTGGTVTLLPAASLDQVKATQTQISSGMAQIKANLDVAKTALGKDDPDVQALQGKLDGLQKVLDGGGTPTAGDFYKIRKSMIGPISTRVGAATQREKIQQQQADTLKAQQEAANATPDAQVSLARRKKQAEQIVSQGNPADAGKLLADGSLTLSELKSRGTTPDFIVRATNAAQKIDPAFNPQKSEADLQVAKSEDNVKFFGSAKSLTDPGGTLDQLKDAGAKIPQNTFKPFNSIADATEAASGSGPLAKYAAVALGVADDYSKVMGGGAGSDTSRTQALKLIGRSAVPEERAAAIEGIRGAVGSQMTSRIGNNKVMKNMYGGAPAAPASDFFSRFGGKKL